MHAGPAARAAGARGVVSSGLGGGRGTVSEGDSHRRPSIAVVGGYGTGITFRLPRAPLAGETLVARALSVDHGGKGSNQAIAARRLGADVSLLTAVGPDAFGGSSHQLWRDEGVKTEHVRTGKLPTMIAAILVEESGENRIAVAVGALGELETGDVDSFAEEIAAADVCVVSLEVPAHVAARALEIAKQRGTLAVLNPAPFIDLPPGAVEGADVVVPNRTEAELLTGSAPGTEPALLVDRLRERCQGTVVLTLGAAGAVVDDGRTRRAVPAAPAPAVVDTTGAGDAFTGALATCLARGLEAGAAAEVAAAAAAYSVGIASVVPSLPQLSDLPEAVQARLLSG